MYKIFAWFLYHKTKQLEELPKRTPVEYSGPYRSNKLSVFIMSFVIIL